MAQKTPPATPSSPPDTVALILAGGRARRLGGADKALLPLNGRTLLAHVAAALGAPEIPLAISANGAPERFAGYGFPVLPDADDSRPGPLAGVLAGLCWAQGLGASALLSAPVDCPFLPADLLARLRQASSRQAPVFAQAGGRAHPTIALWPVALAGSLAAALARKERRMMDFMVLQGAASVEWAQEAAFMNINTRQDLARAAALLAQRRKT